MRSSAGRTKRNRVRRGSGGGGSEAAGHPLEVRPARAGAYTSPVAQPAARHPISDDDAPSLDPAAVERAYVRERARRRARSARANDARHSNARFWVVLAVLTFLTVFLALTAWHEIQTTFGI
jgi:hypothetical protein